MANKEHLQRLKQGVSVWNAWRREHPEIWIDFTGADLSGVRLREANLWHADFSKAALKGADFCWAELRGADLSGSDLSEAVLSRANLSRVNFRDANLRWARLSGSDLSEAVLSGTNLSGANLSEAVLSGAHLHGAILKGVDFRQANLHTANLTQADLTNADLTEALLIRTNFQDAKLNHCRIYGIAAWDLNLARAEQSELIITAQGEPTITVDSLEVAQFIYLLHNEKIRHVIDTITSKAVLILGRFTQERKAVLDALREALRTRDRLPIVFDFTGPGSQTTDETISTLAHIARFVIADLTDAKSILQELRAIVPNSPSVLVQPILLVSQEEPGMFDFFRRFPWVLEPYRYHSQEELLDALDAKILASAEAKVRELTEHRRALPEAQLNPPPATG